MWSPRAKLLILGSVGGLLVAVGCGIAYQAAMIHFPYKRVIVAGPLVTGALIGAVLMGASWLARCPRGGTLILLAVHLSLVACAASWWQAVRHARGSGLEWIEADHDFTMRKLDRIARSLLQRGPEPEPREERIASPTAAEYLDFRLRRGWPERGEELSAFGVGFTWILEACLIVAMAVMFACGFVNTVPFCETHKAWTRVVHDAVVTKADADLIRKAGFEGDVDAVLRCPRRLDSETVAQFVVHRCPQCDFTAMTVTLHWVEPRLFRRKNRKEEEDVFGSPVPLNESQVRALYDEAERRADHS